MTEIPDKICFSIGEAAKIAGVEPYVLRYWESQFRIIRPQKDRAGRRIYRKKDLETVLRVKRMLHEQGHTIAGARKILKEAVDEDQGPSRAELLSLTREIKEELKSIQRRLR